MQKQKFSVKRVAAGVLVGFIAVTAFAGVGRLSQANMFNGLFSWLVAENCYYDYYGEYVCDDGSYDSSYDGTNCWDSAGNYICGDDTGSYDTYTPLDCSPDGWVVYDSSGYEYCEYPSYDDSYDYVNCEEYGMDWFADGQGGCYQDTGIWDCDSGYHYDSVTQSCWPDDYYDDSYDDCYYDSAGNYVCGEYDDGYGTTQCWDSAGNYICEDDYYHDYDDSSDDYYDDSQWEDEEDSQWWEFWEGDDDDWREDQLEEMADFLEETSYWEEDAEEAEEEIEEWLEDIEDRMADWEEDLDEMGDKLTSAQRAVYEDAIDYADMAYDEVSDTLGEFAGIKSDIAATVQAMETAYQNFASGTAENSNDFWDANSSGGNQWTWIWMSKAEMYGRLLHTYEFLIEAVRVQMETGMSVDEIGGDFADEVGKAEDAISAVVALLAGLDSMVADAEADIAEGRDTWRATDDIQDLFDDIRDDYLDDDRDRWDSLEDAWELVHERDMEEFAMKEIEFLREELDFVQQELDRLASEGVDVSEAEALVEKALGLLDEMEATDDMDDLEDLFHELEDLEHEANRIFDELGLGHFGPDKRHVYAETVDVNDPDALLGLLGNVPENVLEQVIDMLLGSVSTVQMESFIEYGDKFGDVGFFDSASTAFVEGDKLDAMIEDKLAILGELDAKIDKMEQAIGAMQDKLDELANKVAGYNWYGDASDEAQSKIDELEEALDAAGSDEEKESILASFDAEFNELIEDAKDDKFEDGLIPFKDTDDDQWYTSYVWDVLEEGVIGGYKDADGNATGYYGPGDNVTIGETLKLALETAGEGEGRGDSSNPYAQSHWSAGYFDKGEDLGLSVTGDYTQNPDEHATRGEVVQTMFESLGVDLPNYGSTDFSDVPEYHNHADAIQYAKDLGIVSGDDTTGNFRPDDSVNRAETAKIVDQFMETAELEGWI